MEKHKCVIIGTGPAGYTAAIYASRANLNPIIYTGLEPGGQLTTTTDVENFPGYPDGIMGPEMMEDLKKQAERFGTDIRFGLVTKAELSDIPGEYHTLTIDESVKIQAQTVIIATGASAKYLGLESEKKMMGHGVSACAICDGFFFKGQEVVVVGGGDSAAEEATYLAKLCPKVTVVVRKDHFKASKIMADRVMNTPNINVLFNTETLEVLGEKTVDGVRVKNNETGEESIIPAQGFFVAIGHKPNTDIFKGQLDMDEVGYILTKPGTATTNKPGVFATGDAQDKVYRQAITAAGSGCKGALEAERYLQEFEEEVEVAQIEG
ncbi:MAG: thioredoxin-disulfide reductase [Owenweeksia sp.]|nr:thioredoxin-disulfide reductase [Owenweeksia sp.]MBF98251.1 thioredoxin-disulfide reductase [Owenweeksia sp.]HBF18756.1 thioredoxin-disulfide reductase [Cryomorphaceae bacterium]|tara:strand:- start:4 stop:969 length:966 start_codon:yes stop_codon:yes gene_type:complete